MTAVAEQTAVDFARQREVSMRCADSFRQKRCCGKLKTSRRMSATYSAYRQVPMVVALPETEEQVCRILRICHEMLVPVVARGAGTAFGGALPSGNG